MKSHPPNPSHAQRRLRPAASEPATGVNRDVWPRLLQVYSTGEVLFFATAGDDRYGSEYNVVAPAKFPAVISVANIAVSGEKYAFSNSNSKVGAAAAQAGTVRRAGGAACSQQRLVA